MATMSELEAELTSKNAQLTKELKALEELIPSTITAVFPHFNVKEFGNDYATMMNSFRWKVIENRANGMGSTIRITTKQIIDEELIDQSQNQPEHAARL